MAVSRDKTARRSQPDYCAGIDSEIVGGRARGGVATRVNTIATPAGPESTSTLHVACGAYAASAVVSAVIVKLTTQPVVASEPFRDQLLKSYRTPFMVASAGAVRVTSE